MPHFLVHDLNYTRDISLEPGKETLLKTVTLQF